MRKLLQVVVAGLAAVSFSALAADKTEVDANTKIQGDAKTEKSTGSHANSAGNAGVGASTEIKTDKMSKKKNKKEKRATSGAGGTTAPMTKDEPAPAPAPEKKTN
ncbi:MAG TPA: hypothetical protein VN675_07135 [Burkholderiales bacterium]|nr:hypothetical protein [Burkholderiales bacterium]